MSGVRAASRGYISIVIGFSGGTIETEVVAHILEDLGALKSPWKGIEPRPHDWTNARPTIAQSGNPIRLVLLGNNIT